MPKDECWALFDRNGRHIIIKAVSKITGQLETLDYYADYNSARIGLTYIEQEDIDKHGVQIREVPVA